MSTSTQKDEKITGLASQSASMKLADLVRLSNEVRLALVESAGEITDETCKALLILEDSMPKKVDGYKFLVTDLECEAEKFKTKADEYSRLAESCKRYAKGLKDRLKLACIAMNVDELQGNEYRWKLQKSKPSVIIDDETLVPSKYKNVVQTTEIIKDEILEDFKKDISVPGCRLEQNSHIRCYPNNKKGA